MNPAISVIHATRGRPKKALETMYRWNDLAADPENVEYLFVVNKSDGSQVELVYDRTRTKFEMGIVFADVNYSAPAWNCGATAARGDIFVQGQDDVYPPQGWDHTLIQRIHDAGGPTEPIVVSVSDGYRKGDAANLMCSAICTRAYRDMEGHFLYPGFRSVYSDDEFSVRAYAHAADGEAKVLIARDLEFRHENPIHNKSIPFDETHAHENSPEAYSIGFRLFSERNKRLIDRGFVKW